MNEAQVDKQDQALMAAARVELERDAQALDAVTVARLRRARGRALEAAGPRLPPRVWLPATAMAALVITVAGLLLFRGPVYLSDDTDPIAVLDDSYELYDNLEFYEWMETQADEGRG